MLIFFHLISFSYAKAPIISQGHWRKMIDISDKTALLHRY